MWIAAKCGDVFMHPAQPCDLVQQAIVTGAVIRHLAGQLGMRQKAENAEPIVQGHYDDSSPRHALAVIARFGAVPGHKTAAMEIDKHRVPCCCDRSGNPDVEVQTVLA